MSVFRNPIALVGSVCVFVGSILWAIFEGGYEPWIATMASFFGIANNWETGLAFLRRQDRIPPEEKIRLRSKWAPVFRHYFEESARNGRQSDVIIHDIARLDDYPATSDTNGIASWFRVGLMGAYNTGVLLGLRWTHLVERDGIWVECLDPHDEPAIKVILLGELPFEAIEETNFNGDEFYYKPHIFCRFEFDGQPYKRLYFGEQRQLDDGFPYFYPEIVEFVEQKGPPMFRITAIIHLVAGSALGGSLIVAALVMGVSSLWMLLGLGVLGYVIAVPVAYYIARAMIDRP